MLTMCALCLKMRVAVRGRSWLEKTAAAEVVGATLCGPKNTCVGAILCVFRRGSTFVLTLMQLQRWGYGGDAVFCQITLHSI